MLTEDYAVQLDTFSGPLDLLLHLIRRAEVDVSAISIARITDQYLHHLDSIARIDIEPAGEFLVTAATLIELKSRMLAPGIEGEGEGEGLSRAETSGDPAAELVRALLQYKRFRESAESLERRREAWRHRHELVPIAIPDPPAKDADEEPPLDLEDLTLFDLVQAYARVAETVVFERLKGHAVVDDDTPIELHAADVLDRLRAAGAAAGDVPWAGRPAMPMRALFHDRSRVEVIGLFLAVLELVRQRMVAVHQNDLSREVTIAMLEPEARADGPASAEGAGAA